MTPLLEHWLGHAYRAAISGHPDRLEFALATLRERFAADEGLRAEALAELARIDELAAMCGGPHMLHRRCVVSATHRNTLLAVL